MIDSPHTDRQVARLARVRDEELAAVASGPAARALLASIVAERDVPVPRRFPVRELLLAASVVGAVTGAVVIAPSLLDDAGGATSYANAAIDVKLEGRFFVGRIKDPLAERDQFVEAFRAVGKDVDIELVPVTPRLVGRLIEAGGGGPGSGETSSDVESSGPERVDCALLPARCTLVIRISEDTTGSVHYKIGRAAQPGEATQDPTGRLGDPPAHSGDGDAKSGGSGK